MYRYIRVSRIMNVLNSMLDSHHRAIVASAQADGIAQTYLDQFASGRRFNSATDAERAAAADLEWQLRVGQNQMYDRWAARDAAVLSAMLQAITAGVIDMKNDEDVEISKV